MTDYEALYTELRRQVRRFTAEVTVNNTEASAPRGAYNAMEELVYCPSELRPSEQLSLFAA